MSQSLLRFPQFHQMRQNDFQPFSGNLGPREYMIMGQCVSDLQVIIALGGSIATRPIDNRQRRRVYLHAFLDQRVSAARFLLANN